MPFQLSASNDVCTRPRTSSELKDTSLLLSSKSLDMSLSLVYFISNFLLSHGHEFSAMNKTKTRLQNKFGGSFREW